MYPSFSFILTIFVSFRSPIEEEDVVDDDFDVSENEKDDDDDEDGGPPDRGAAGDAALAREERARAKKAAGYVDPARKRAAAAATGATAAAGAPKRPRAARSTAAGSAAAEVPTEGIATQRQQRRAAAKAEERRGEAKAEKKAALAARARAQGLTPEELMQRQRERTQAVYRVLTQEEQLEQAAATELINRESLAELLRIEEAQKRVTVRKLAVIGPAVRVRDREGATEVSFKYCDPFPELNESPESSYASTAVSPSASGAGATATAAAASDLASPWVPPPRLRRLAAPAPLVCPVTGLPARYRDPVSGLPFATAAALKQLRERAAAGAITAQAYWAACFDVVGWAVAAYAAAAEELRPEPSKAVAAGWGLGGGPAALGGAGRGAGMAMGDDDALAGGAGARRGVVGRARKAAAK